ncbi:MAG: acyltransferase [Burkholderiales bacterium]
MKVTHRAEIFCHGAKRDQVRIGDDFIVDGTLEIYQHGQLNIGMRVFVGRARVYCARSVTIGDYTLISDNVTVMDSDLHPRSASRRQTISDDWANGRFPDVYTETPGAPVSIGKSVWIGYGSLILKGVSIGDGAIVGAGSVVTEDVPPWTIVAGNPARVIRELGPNER